MTDVDFLDWADPFAPDTTMSDPVRAAMRTALDSGASAHYTLQVGSFDLREAVATKLRDKNGIEADPSTEILITPGSDSGLFYSMMPFLLPGDEVLIADPSYPNNAVNARLLGATPVRVPLHRDEGFQIDAEAFASRLSGRTRMVMLTHPNNPTSTVARRERLEALCKLIVERDLILVCDQAFEDLVYDDIEFVSPATLPGMRERTLTLCSLSKGFGLSGFRIGYIAAASTLMEALHGAAVNVLGAPNALAQIGALAAFRHSGQLRETWAKLERRRRLAYEIFADAPGTECLKPESAMMLWIEVSRLGTSSEIARLVLDEARVAIGTGDSYGAQGVGHLRVVHGCYADEDRALAACRRVAAVLRQRAENLRLC